MRRLLTLFFAEEIPFALVTFVALLMFLQMGSPMAEATLLTALLSVPLALRPLCARAVQRVRHLRTAIHLSEMLTTLVLFALAASFGYGVVWIFVSLLIVSILYAWHELLTQAYYERLFPQRCRLRMATSRIVASHISTILTYGTLILVVGTMEVFFRRIGRAWGMGCYLTAGVFLVFTLSHFLALKPRAQAPLPCPPSTMQDGAGTKWKSLTKPLATLFLMLLPQSLMFHTRVLFLFSDTAQGGLACTIQEIGFAQGTIGVMAFCLGITIGRSLMRWIPERKIYWPLTILLGLSPAVYLVMAIEPPSSLGVLCIATFQAQLLFGMGLTACRIPIKALCGTRYHGNANLLAIPLVTACMLPAAALSGWMVSQMSFPCFFLMDTLTAPLCWALIWFCRLGMKKSSKEGWESQDLSL